MRGTKRVALTMLVIATLVTSIMAVNSSAATVIGEFELDGNLIDSAPGIPYDWDTLPGAVIFNDPDAGSGCAAGEDDIFGGSSDEEVPGEWIFDCGSVPQKDDFLEAGIGTRKIGTDTWLYLYFIRKFDGGSAVLNYEFNQSDDTFDNDGNSATPEVPVRTAGDLLFNLEVAGGGAQTTIQVFEWDGNQEIGNWVQIVDGTPVRGTDWDVATNGNPNDNKGRFTLAELALRLEAFGVTPSCPGLGKAWVKSNSTFDFENGTLKDRTVRKDVPLSNCGIKDWSFTLSPHGIAGVTVKAVYTVEGGTTRSITLTDPDGDGIYTATDDQIPPGTVSYHFEVLNGDALIWKSEEAFETFVEGERKLNQGALAFEISLTPEEAENFAGDPHVFTATVTDAATGEGLPNVPVSFALANGTPDGCGSITPASGLTGSNGQITATVTSAGPCTTDVVAWINGTQNGATAGLDAGEANDVSTKAFVTYALAVTPPSATNEAGKEHTFTVLLTKDSGAGAAGLPGATVDLSIDAAEGSDAHFTSINGTAASGTEATCVTREDDPQTAADEAGTCIVKIVATTPGDLTLNASHTASDSAGTTKVIEGSADKSFHAFDLSIDGGGQTNLSGQEHTFTVKLTRDVGDGPAGYPGQTVTLTLAKGATDAHFVSINGAPASGTETTCVTREDDPQTETDEAGTCTVTITSSESGTATLTASWETDLDSGTVTLTETATKQFSSFDIEIDGGDQINEVGTEHTFIVKLTRDDGDGPIGYPGQSVALSLNVGTTDAQFVSINGEPAAGTETVCVTQADDPNTTANEAGTCVVVITASEPGTVILTAKWEGLLDSGPVVVEETVTKRFVDFDLTVTPPEAQNEIGQPHTFLVTLTEDGGDGPAGLAGETVGLSLDPGDSDAHFVEINGEPASGTEGSCVTRADDPLTEANEAGTCAVTITASTAGTATLTASWETELDSGTVTREASATKSFLDFELTVNPPKAFNRVGEPHTFTVLLTKNTGGGSIGFGGQTVHLVLNAGDTDAHFTSINGDPAAGTEAGCVTSQDDPETPADEAGICTVTITSSTAGSVTLTATWEDEIGGATVTRTDTAEKIFLSIALTKNACPATSSPRGGIVDYAIAFSIGGSSLSNATIVDELPEGMALVSASQIGGVTSSVDGGAVTWSFPTLAAGSYTGSIRARILESVANGTELTNTVTLDSDEISPEVATHELVVSDEGRAGSSRAYGISLDLLGSEVIAPTPDSEETNPGEVLSIPDPFGSDTPLLELLSVSESDDSTADQESHSATASALNVDLNVPGVLRLKADTVIAKTTSQASATSAGSSRGGSLIQGLVINDVNYGAVSEPTTVLVRDPLSGDVLAEVHLLETIRTGAAAGEAQPNGDTEFASGIAVNGIHVKVHLLDLVDLIVSQSESSAEFPSGIGCDGEIPAVSGSAYALGINLKPDSENGIDLGSVKVGEVDLPITGGEDKSTLADVYVPGIVSASVAGAGTQGEITDGEDGDTVPVEATSEAHIVNADLLDGTIRARAVDVISHTEAGAMPEGETEIAYLEIGGTDVCAALGLGSVCTPEPNTELLIPGGPILVVLNEQIPEPGGLTVNGVHIWILGKDNPFGLPVGADIVISSAHSDAHPAGSIVVDDSPATINVRALSAPSAKRLRRIEVPRTFEVPVAVPIAPVLDVPVVSVPEILQDPVAVVDDLIDLALPEAVLEDATQLIDTLTDPGALLEALADPATLLEGLADPAAALEALAEATGAVVEEDQPASAETVQPDLTHEQLTARLLRLVGL